MAPLASIVLAAGRSRRMRSSLPKVLHEVLGVPLVVHVLRALREAFPGSSDDASPDDAAAKLPSLGPTVLVVSPEHREVVGEALAQLAGEGADWSDLRLAVQEEARGTAHAVLSAREALGDFSGTALVLLGDAPCVSPAALQELARSHHESNARLSVLSGEVSAPFGYGRIVRGLDGDLAAIIEERDADAKVRALCEINSGTFALELPELWGVLERVEPSPRTGELYVTEAVELVKARGGRVHAVRAAAGEDVLGVNTRVQLAQVTSTLRARINARHMENGVTIVDPASTFIDARATLEPDVRVEPFTVIQGPCVIRSGAVLGPFANLRGGSEVGAEARIGNFVEVVRSKVGAGSRALHLSYLGDCELGPRTNVGAGTVFANWDGTSHQRSEVGEGTALGSNTVLIGPCTLGAGAKTGAGAVIVRSEVPAGETWVGVPAQALPKGASTANAEGIQ